MIDRGASIVEGNYCLLAHPTIHARTFLIRRIDSRIRSVTKKNIIDINLNTLHTTGSIQMYSNFANFIESSIIHERSRPVFPTCYIIITNDIKEVGRITRSPGCTKVTTLRRTTVFDCGVDCIL